jgi:hypothetical protein
VSLRAAAVFFTPAASMCRAHIPVAVSSASSRGAPCPAHQAAHWAMSRR